MADELKPTTINEYLERHPELSPLLDVDKNGNVTCFGWVSPVYDFPEEILEKFRGMAKD